MMKVDVRMFVISTAKFCLEIARLFCELNEKIFICYYKQISFLFSLGKIITENNYIVLVNGKLYCFTIKPIYQYMTQYNENVM